MACSCILTAFAGYYSYTEHPRSEDYGSVLTVAAKRFVENVRNFQGDDKVTLELSLYSYDHLASSDPENKLSIVLSSLETSLLKNKQLFSSGVLYSMCIVAMISRAFAESFERRTKSSPSKDDGNDGLEPLAADKREDGLAAMFSLIKFSDLKEHNPLKMVCACAGAEVHSGKSWKAPLTASQI